MASGLGAVRSEMASGLGAARSETASGLAAVRADFAERLAKHHSSLILWMFTFWAGNVIATAGLVLAAAALLRH
jgi:hypothetical protein